MQQAQACKVKERYILSSFTVSLTNLQGEWRYEKIDINDDLRSFKKKKKYQKKFPKQEASERDADTGKYKQLQEAIPCT